MSRHTTFRIGGPARMFLEPDSAMQLEKLAQYLSSHEVNWLVLGNGSNLLCRDQGFDGVVIHLGYRFSTLSLEAGGKIRGQAGGMLAALSRFAAEHSLSGMEFACGIPGSIGGAVYMNAGAYGGEISQVLTQVTHLTVSEGKVRLRTLPVSALEMSYRHSRYQSSEEWIVEAVFQLETGSREESLAKMEQLLKSRREKQPLEYPSAGSTFKRPEGAYAASLIDQCGLKGFSVGDAQVSEKHAGFVINRGRASCDDVLSLMELVRERVYVQTGYLLEPEVRII